MMNNTNDNIEKQIDQANRNRILAETEFSKLLIYISGGGVVLLINLYIILGDRIRDYVSILIKGVMVFFSITLALSIVSWYLSILVFELYIKELYSRQVDSKEKKQKNNIVNIINCIKEINFCFCLIAIFILIFIFLFKI